MTISPEDQIQRALELVKLGDPDAFVAGGALRDSLLDVPLKDIDVYVGPDFDSTNLNTASSWAIKAKNQTEVEEYSEFYGDKITAIYSAGFNSPVPADFGDLFHMDFELPIQIIQLKDASDIQSVLADFDLGFCQMAFDGERLHGTTLFFRDVAEGTATCTLKKTDTRFPHSLKRAERLQLRHPTRRFLYPL